MPFESLSGGAKEQLGIVARLAVAALVDKEDTVPVMLDDALGFTDPDRLAKMAAVFDTVGGTGPGDRADLQPGPVRRHRRRPADRTDRLGDRLGGALRTRGQGAEPEMVAQGVTGVLGAEQAAPLQFRDHAVDEVVEGARASGPPTP